MEHERIMAKKHCEIISIEFMRKLAECNSCKLTSQKCRNDLYKNYSKFINKCIVEKLYN